MPAAEASPEWRSAPWLRRFCHPPFRFVFSLIWGAGTQGLENVPRTGPVIIAANHVSLADGLMLALVLGPMRFMRGLGKQELFQVPGLGWFLRNTGFIPLDRSGDVSAMRKAIDAVKAGGCLQLFPEGTRSKDGRPGKPKAGLAFIASHSGALVVPTRVVNTDKFPRPARMEARFGSPLRFEADPADRAACLAFGQTVMDRIFAL